MYFLYQIFLLNCCFSAKKSKAQESSNKIYLPDLLSLIRRVTFTDSQGSFPHVCKQTGHNLTPMYLTSRTRPINQRTYIYLLSTQSSMGGSRAVMSLYHIFSVEADIFPCLCTCGQCGSFLMKTARTLQKEERL